MGSENSSVFYLVATYFILLSTYWWQKQRGRVAACPPRFLQNRRCCQAAAALLLANLDFRPCVIPATVRHSAVGKYFIEFACPGMKLLNPYHISRHTLTFNICIRTKVEVDQSKAKVGQKVSTSKTSIDHTKSCLKQN